MNIEETNASFQSTWLTVLCKGSVTQLDVKGIKNWVHKKWDRLKIKVFYNISLSSTQSLQCPQWPLTPGGMRRHSHCTMHMHIKTLQHCNIVITFRAADKIRWQVSLLELLVGAKNYRKWSRKHLSGERLPVCLVSFAACYHAHLFVEFAVWCG